MITVNIRSFYETVTSLFIIFALKKLLTITKKPCSFCLELLLYDSPGKNINFLAWQNVYEQNKIKSKRI